LKEDFDFAHIK